MQALDVAWGFLKGSKEGPTKLRYGVLSTNRQKPENKNPGRYWSERGEYLEEKYGPHDNLPLGMATRHSPFKVEDVPGVPGMVFVNGRMLAQHDWDRLKREHGVGGPESHMGLSLRGLGQLFARYHRLPQRHNATEEERKNWDEVYSKAREAIIRGDERKIREFMTRVAPVMAHEVMHGMEDLPWDNPKKYDKPSFPQTEIPAYILQHATEWAHEARERDEEAKRLGKVKPGPFMNFLNAALGRILRPSLENQPWKEEAQPSIIDEAVNTLHNQRVMPRGEEKRLDEPDNPDYEYKLTPTFS